MNALLIGGGGALLLLALLGKRDEASASEAVPRAEDDRIDGEGGATAPVDPEKEGQPSSPTQVMTVVETPKPDVKTAPPPPEPDLGLIVGEFTDDSGNTAWCSELVSGEVACEDTDNTIKEINFLGLSKLVI